MILNDLLDYLQGLINLNDLIFISPYNSNSPYPKGDWALMVPLNINNLGWQQLRNNGEESGNVNIILDTQQLYSIQFDFYGENAYSNAIIAKQQLMYGITSNKKSLCSLKKFSEIRNLTELLENKHYKSRYSFDVDLYINDTYTIIEPYFTNAKITTKFY